MKRQKIDLKSIKDVLSREEMRKIMAGSDGMACSAESTACIEKVTCECSIGTCTGYEYEVECICEEDGEEVKKYSSCLA